MCEEDFGPLGRRSARSHRREGKGDGFGVSRCKEKQGIGGREVGRREGEEGEGGLVREGEESRVRCARGELEEGVATGIAYSQGLEAQGIRW